MKVNFNIPILTYRGDNLKDPNGNDIPLKDSICRILSAITMGTDEDKMMVAGLIEKMWAESGEMEITEQEADVIKANIKGLPVILFSQIYKMLDKQ
jgi:ABC-type transport system substrate-binding protein